jgi:HEAT repeat protein
LLQRKSDRLLDKFDDERYESRLIVLLKDVSPEVRRLSAKLLRVYGTDRSVPALIKALKTADETVKRNALFALDIIGDERAKRPLSELRKDNDQNIRIAASRALEKYCDPVYLDDNDPMMRAAALRCFEKRGNVGVYESALAELVARKSRPQMIAAMDVLSKTEDARAVEPLIIILKEGDIHVAGKAASLLGTIGDHRAVEPLIEKLIYIDGLGRDYVDNGMKYDIIRALTNIGDPRAVPALVRMLKSDSAGVIDKSMSALGEFKDSRAVPGLIAVSDTHRYLQSSIRALGEIGSPAALDHLERLLYKYDGEKDTWIRADILRAIGKINDEKNKMLY